MIMPAKLGPYRILARIGSGGMAEVFTATRFGASGFSKRVAIKALLPEHAEDAELQRLLIAEAKLGAAMSHRNLVGVSDLGVDDGRYYVVMDFVDGSDLERLVAVQRPSEAIALRIVDEVAAALGYLHAFCDEGGRPLGLVHRDVSPANVLVSRNGEVVLGDYGIAKATNAANQTRARVVRGKYAYLSPEQVGGEAVSAKSDQFALGVVLVELISGARPFDGGSVAETMDRIRAASDPRLEGLAEDLVAIVRRCFAVDPASRWPDVGALREALQVARRAREPIDARATAQWVIGALSKPR